MPENVWPLIDIVNYIFFQEETEKQAWTLLFFVPNLIFNPSTPRPHDDNPR